MFSTVLFPLSIIFGNNYLLQYARKQEIPNTITLLIANDNGSKSVVNTVQKESVYVCVW